MLSASWPGLSGLSRPSKSLAPNEERRGWPAQGRPRFSQDGRHLNACPVHGARVRCVGDFYEGGSAMLELAWTALGLWIAALLFFGLVAWLRDGYLMLETWRAGHRR